MARMNWDRVRVKKQQDNDRRIGASPIWQAEWSSNALNEQMRKHIVAVARKIHKREGGSYHCALEKAYEYVKRLPKYQDVMGEKK